MAAAAAASLVIRLSALVVVLVVLCPMASAARYKVGGPGGWRVPPKADKEMLYIKWASPITFFVGDSVEFVYKNDSVIKVSKVGYYHCNETTGIGTGPGPRDGKTLFRLDAPGFAYFASADSKHCNDGQKLIIKVLVAEPGTPTSASPLQAPTEPSSSETRPSPFSPDQGPPSMEHSSATGGPFVASLARAMAQAATLVLACFI